MLQMKLAIWKWVSEVMKSLLSKQVRADSGGGLHAGSNTCRDGHRADLMGYLRPTN